MSIRKEKEKDFYVKHLETFKNLKINDPFFTIKTAFFQKGKYGRHVQFFEWELKKDDDIYIEFYDNVKDSQGIDVDVVPMNSDRQLFKFKNNPFFYEEYEVRETTNGKGETYSTYTVPVSEISAVLVDGTEITYALYEKRKSDVDAKLKIEEDSLPKLQKSLSLFPDFAEQFPTTVEINLESNNESASDILLRIAKDFQKLAQIIK